MTSKVSNNFPNDLQYPQSKSPIKSEKLLLVEGRDAFGFFKAILQELSLLENIEIRNFGGIKDFTTYLRTLKITPGFKKVISLGIIRDAEKLFL